METFRKNALDRLQTLVLQYAGDADFILCGSAADPNRFTRNSDLDLFLLAADIGEGVKIAAELEGKWAAVSQKPELSIGVCCRDSIPDPYFRVSLRLGTDAPEKEGITAALRHPDCRKDHAWEAFCEDTAMRNAADPKKPVNPRTHPDGLRAVWQLKYLVNGGPETDWCAYRDFLPKLFSECGIGFTEGLDEIGPAARKAYRIKAMQWGIDADGIRSVMARPESLRIDFALSDPETRAALSFTDPSAAVLETIAVHHADDPRVRMGLCFNRSTPVSVLRKMIEAPDWLKNRLLLRKRCYVHPAGDKRFREAARVRELVPRLLAAIEKKGKR